MWARSFLFAALTSRVFNKIDPSENTISGTLSEHQRIAIIPEDRPILKFPNDNKIKFDLYARDYALNHISYSYIPLLSRGEQEYLYYPAFLFIPHSYSFSLS
jgi:hypothetical protein